MFEKETSAPRIDDLLQTKQIPDLSPLTLAEKKRMAVYIRRLLALSPAQAAAERSKWPEREQEDYHNIAGKVI